MTDKEIIALYFKRSENAIEQTDVKYGKLCHSISINILNDTRDSEECVNDTYLTLWNKIPPKEPNPFKAYICRIIKNLSLKKYEFNHAKKRNSEYEASLDELEECVSDGTEASEAVEFKELQMAINMFLSELPEKTINDSKIFLCKFFRKHRKRYEKAVWCKSCCSNCNLCYSAEHWSTDSG